MNVRTACTVLLVASLSIASLGLTDERAQPAANEVLNRYGKRDARLHDPSALARDGDRSWLFSTGQLISSWHSTDLVEWQRGPSVFREMPAWVRDVVPDQRGHFWAPDVIALNGRFLLYYSVSSFGKNSSAIALATAASLNPESEDSGWTDRGIVIQSTATDDFNAIDPAIIQTEAGELWMAFGSFWSGLQLIQLDPATGLRLDPKAPPVPLAWSKEIEAAHIVERDGWFFLFLNHGTCCRGVESTYEIRVGRSRSITGPYFDREGRSLRHGGGTLLLASDGPFIGPGHANITLRPEGDLLHCHFYDATERGRSFLAIMPIEWDAWGWPVVPAATP